MKITNIMNFTRYYEPRNLEVQAKMPQTTRALLNLVNEYKLPATFLIQYDALCNEEYVSIFKSEAGENIELGFWYEVVEPLTSDIGIPYNSARGYKWDWNIDPGFAISYPNDIKEKLIDRAMEKFKEVFGYYPRTVCSWVLDTYTVNYLCKKYDIDALGICRDQVNTDAYTMVGGYFNGIYYPSVNNMFTPAGSEGMQNKTPIFRLLGPDPIHNYDGAKYCSEGEKCRGVYTLEPACIAGRTESTVDWFFRTYYENESLDIAYTQLGQENSFAMFDLVTPLRMQFEKLIARGVKFEKMCDTGAAFKAKYSLTPPAAVSALDNWDSVDAQSVYYSCKGYTANVFRHESRVFLRSIYLFDDRIPDTYLSERCSTFDSIHENMPIVDTYYQRGDSDGGLGIILDTDAAPFDSKRDTDGNLVVCWDKGCARFDEEGITLTGCKASFTPKMCNTHIEPSGDRLIYEYKGHTYALLVDGGRITKTADAYVFDSDEGDALKLIPMKI